MQRFGNPSAGGSFLPADPAPHTKPASPQARFASLFESSYVRVAAALCVAVLAYFVLLTYFVKTYTDQTYNFRKEEIKRLVEVGLNTLQPLRDQEARGEISAEEARARAVELVRRMTYTYGLGSNYLFMSDYDGVMLVQPFEPKKEGTSQWDLTDVHGKYIIRSLVAAATGPGRSGFVEYEYPPPGSTQPQLKISYVVGIPEWNAYLGTGMYTADLAAQNTGYMRRLLLLTSILGAAIFAVLAFAVPLITSQRRLLCLFGEIEADPGRRPEVPLEEFRRGSEGWRMLAGFQGMLARVDQGTREIQRQNTYLAALHDTALAVIGRLELTDLLQTIVDRASTLVGASDAGVYLVVPGAEALERKVSTGLFSESGAILVARGVGMNGRALETGRPVVVENYASWESRIPTVGKGLGPAMAVPLRAGQELVGVLDLGRKPGSPPFTPDELEIATRFAELVSIALDNSRLHTSLHEANTTLERRVEERTEELQTLLQVSQNVASTLELQPLLHLILDQLKAVVEYTGASIMTLENHSLRVLAYHGPSPEPEMLQMRFPLDTMPVSSAVMAGQKPIVVSDIANDPLDREFRARAGQDVRHALDYVHAWMGVPLVIKGRVIGMLTLEHSNPDFYTDEAARLALAFANQVAIAIENARLYEQAEQSAIAAERNRLARELHDAVSQTLFAASLIASVLPTIWERNQPEARRRLNELAGLTRSALAEMRTLLVELRPAALLEHPLGDLLKQLAEAATGRAGVHVTAEVEGVQPLAPEVQIALYRIAQEALNNMAKHSCAKEATVALVCSDGLVELSVCDNGVGFNPVSIPPDHLGVGIMRERAASIGATLSIDSAPGNGTCVSVTWPIPDGEEAQLSEAVKAM